MKLKVVEEKLIDLESDNELSVNEYLDAIKGNRERVRSLASMLQTVCGLLLSASFVVLFFLIQEKLIRQAFTIYLLMFSAIVAFITSMVFSLLAADVRPPSAVSTKGERLEQQLKIYQAESKWLRAGLILLFMGILLFLASMLVFAIRLS
jgi:Na+/melibiose symporter-like transporter